MKHGHQQPAGTKTSLNARRIGVWSSKTEGTARKSPGKRGPLTTVFHALLVVPMHLLMLSVSFVWKSGSEHTPPPPPAACLFPCPCTCWPLLAMAAWNLASGSWWFQVSRPVTLLSRRGVRLSSCIRQPPADAGGLSRRAPLSQAPELHLLIGIEIRNQFRIQSEPLRHSPAHLA